MSIPNYYNKQYEGVTIDPYVIFLLYNVTCPFRQHAIKKLLRWDSKDPSYDDALFKEVIEILNRGRDVYHSMKQEVDYRETDTWPYDDNKNKEDDIPF